MERDWRVVVFCVSVCVCVSLLSVVAAAAVSFSEVTG